MVKHYNFKKEKATLKIGNRKKPDGQESRGGERKIRERRRKGRGSKEGSDEYQLPMICVFIFYDNCVLIKNR